MLLNGNDFDIHSILNNHGYATTDIFRTHIDSSCPILINLHKPCMSQQLQEEIIIRNTEQLGQGVKS